MKYVLKDEISAVTGVTEATVPSIISGGDRAESTWCRALEYVT
jgi:hypothetical protein